MRLVDAERQAAGIGNAAAAARYREPIANAAAAAPAADAAGLGNALPLVVALEGGLVPTDLVVESLFILAKTRPLDMAKLPFWLVEGRARLKQRLARRAVPEIRTLPYRRDVIAYLAAERRAGRRLILATAADELVAQAVARDVGLFDTVLASDGTSNLDAERMRERLVAEFGAEGFDYLGKGRRDRAVWRAASKVILVHPSPRLREAAARTSKLERVFEDEASPRDTYWHALRVDHWTKNLLLFVPLLASHRFYDLRLLSHALVAFLAFSLCASSIYLLNDLVDLPHDRAHPHKKHRMLASGQLSIARAVALIPLLLFAAVALGLTQPLAFLGVIGAYSLLMLAYCLRLRDVVVLDIVTLAAGYALRVLAGAAATNLAAPPWLLASCLLFFAGLALLKRYAELVAMQALPGTEVQAHAYRGRHDRLVALFGCASGYLAVFVLALHTAVEPHFDARTGLVWIVLLLLGYWVTHMWLMAKRGLISNDPVGFALRDPVSRAVAVATATSLLVAM